MSPAKVTKTNPSMMDVARHAGVSIATVSNVINEKGRVSEPTADRVRRAVEELGFVRNDAARQLATGAPRSLGMVLADLNNSLFVDMAHGAQQGAEEAGLRLLLGDAGCRIDRQNDYLTLFDEARVGGVLLAPMEDSSVGIEQMRAHGRAIVLLNYTQQGAECCTVLVDNEQVGYLAVKHLLSLGRTRLAFIAARDYYQPVHARREGARRAVAEHPTATLEEIDTDGLRYEHGRDLALALESLPPGERPHGIVAVTDDLANGIAAGLHERGIAEVPHEVSIIGCEDNRSAIGGPVPLTSVSLHGVEVGEVATELLLEELVTPVAEHVHRTVVVAPSLVVRSSTAVLGKHATSV